MKKTLLGFVAAATLLSFAAPVFAADEAPADAAKTPKKGKKKAKKGGDDGAAAPAADDAAKK
jgi:hypothetical protein